MTVWAFTSPALTSAVKSMPAVRGVPSRPGACVAPQVFVLSHSHGLLASAALPSSLMRTSVASGRRQSTPSTYSGFSGSLSVRLPLALR